MIKEEDIDIFKDFPIDRRRNKDRNAPLLNIIFAGGTFGNFLKFFLDKFSKLTPDIQGDPFGNLGTSHKKIDENNYSHQIQRYHSTFINDNKGEENLNVCQILPNTDMDYLYLKTSQWFRIEDRQFLPDHLWQKKIKKINDLAFNEPVKNILNLYLLKDMEHIPKFIVRDWYKLEFLQDHKKHYNYLWFKKFREHDFFSKQKTYHFALESFFDFDTFIKNTKILDRQYDLQIDFDRISEMKYLFDKGYKLDILRQKVNHTKKIIERLSTNENISIEALDVSMEGFIYAHIEKKYTDIQMPLTNDFFKSTKDIKEFIKCFPNWYKKPNPNL